MICLRVIRLVQELLLWVFMLVISLSPFVALAIAQHSVNHKVRAAVWPPQSSMPEGPALDRDQI